MEPTIRLAEPASPRREQRASERRHTSLPGRLVWRDARSAMRFATVLVRNISAHGAYVECLSGTPIPLYRLVFLQTERDAAGRADVPVSLRHGRVLSAVYRVGPPQSSTGVPQGYGLRLLVEPCRREATSDSRQTHSSLTSAEALA